MVGAQGKSPQEVAAGLIGCGPGVLVWDQLGCDVTLVNSGGFQLRVEVEVGGLAHPSGEVDDG